jgi:hypothetical protein
MVNNYRYGSEDSKESANRVFHDLIRTTGEIFGVSPELCRSVKDCSNLKDFCVGLLEDPNHHAWREPYQRLGKQDRYRLAGTLFLSRKLLSFPPDPDQWRRHAALMKEPAPPPPPGYLTFLATELDKMFPRGWDRRYEQHVERHAPLESACLEFSRGKGGARAYAHLIGRDSFMDHASGWGVSANVYPVRYSVVRTGGKDRGVTVSSGASQLLAPLHRTLYDFISKFSWVLRGDAKPARFSRFQARKGEVFVSGDYESATDNLSLETAKFILGRILSRCRSVPEHIREYAMTSLQAVIQYPDGSLVWQKRGQLMGNFLSFPLLCLQNYLAFRFLVPRDVPVKINGDDIVFRATRKEFEIWADGVRHLGLTLSRGKTLVNGRAFSLNSSFFWAGNGTVRGLPVLRGSMLVSDGVPSAGSFTKFQKGWAGESRSKIGGLFLRSHKRAIQTTGRSVVEGLGIPADNSQLFRSGLHHREAWYRGTEVQARQNQPEIPIPPIDVGSPVACNWTKVPASAVSRAQELKWSTMYRDFCALIPWSYCFAQRRKDAGDLWWGEVARGGREALWMRFFRNSRRGGLLPRLIGRPNFSINLTLRSPRAVSSRKRHVWIPRGELAPLSRPGVGCNLFAKARAFGTLQSHFVAGSEVR